MNKPRITDNLISQAVELHAEMDRHIGRLRVKYMFAFGAIMKRVIHLGKYQKKKSGCIAMSVAMAVRGCSVGDKHLYDCLRTAEVFTDTQRKLILANSDLNQTDIKALLAMHYREKILDEIWTGKRQPPYLLWKERFPNQTATMDKTRVAPEIQATRDPLKIELRIYDPERFRWGLQSLLSQKPQDDILSALNAAVEQLNKNRASANQLRKWMLKE